jgi:nitroreductase
MINTATNDDDAAAIAGVIRNRRTINFFKKELPPKELVLQAIDIARWAPNHHLSEPWRFYLLSEQTKKTIVDLNADLVARKKGEHAGELKRDRWSSIPGWLVVTCLRSSDDLRAREDYAATCCSIYALSLYLWAQGVGTKWTTGEVTRDPRFYDAIWTDPVIESVVGLIWYGYASEIPVTARKPVSEIVVEI